MTSTSGFVMRNVRSNFNAGKANKPSNRRAGPARQEEWSLENLKEAALAAATSGTVTSLVTTAALALLARAEGRGVFQPTNATSHWLHGQQAGRFGKVDARHTLLGYATHHLSSVFWALPFEAWLASGHSRTLATVLKKAALTAMLAALVDYGWMPKRLTPGWETVLSRRSVGLTFAAMAIGLAAGGLISRRRQRSGLK